MMLAKLVTFHGFSNWVGHIVTVGAVGFIAPKAAYVAPRIRLEFICAWLKIANDVGIASRAYPFS